MSGSGRSASHNGAPDRFILCSGGKDSAALAREERIELEAEGFRVMAKMDDLEERVDRDDERGTWAWGSFTKQEQKRLAAAADDAQDKLASWGCGGHCSMPSVQTDGGTSVKDHCPNCGETGACHLTASESEGSFDEWLCQNDNCRVFLYEVTPSLHTDK